MKKADPFLPHHCTSCGVECEARFSLGSVHLKQICNNCGRYVKFFNKDLLPTIREIKEKIWYIAEGDVKAINETKQKCEFIELPNGLTKKLQYWKLYLTLIK